MLLRAGLSLVWRLAVENRGTLPAAGCALRIEVADFLDSGPIALRELAPGEKQALDGVPWLRSGFARAARLTAAQKTVRCHRTYLAKMGGTIAACNVEDGVSFVLTLQRATGGETR